jgi:hypothetical protein
MKIDLTVLDKYRERTLYITSDYAHMLEFKYEEINSFYYMDRQNKFWLEKDFMEQLNLDTKGLFNKYLDTRDHEQKLFVKIDSIEELFSQIDTSSAFLSLLTIITSNSRYGAPRKHITKNKKVFDIQIRDNSSDSSLLLSNIVI